MNGQWKTPVEMEISTAVAAAQNEHGMGLEQDRSGRFGADDLRRIVAALRGCDPEDVDATARECVEELGKRCDFAVGAGSRTRLRKDEKQNILAVLQGNEPSNSSDDEDDDRIDLAYDDIPSDEATADAIEADCGVRPTRVRWETGFRQYVEARFNRDDYDVDPRDSVTDLEIVRSSYGRSWSSKGGERTVTHYRKLGFDLGDMLAAVEESR